MTLHAACARTERTHTVAIERFLYAPDSMRVEPGDTLVFVNRDAVPHTATARDKRWDTGEIAPGDSAAVAVDAAGEYFCAYHPTMKGVVIRGGR